MAQKKILFVTASTAYGGQTFYNKSLVKHAIDQGWDVTFETGDKDVIEEYANLDVTIYTLPEIGRPINPIKDVTSLWKMYKYIKEQKFDIVHTHTSKGGFIGRIAASWAKVPVVLHSVQGFAFHEFSPKTETFIFSTLEKIAAKYCDGVIFVNDYDYELALNKKLITKDKAYLINNGVAPEKVQLSSEDQKKARQGFEKEFEIPSNAKVIGAIARLYEQKGIEYLIKAIPKIIKGHEDVYFFIAGDGPLKDDFEKLIDELNIRHRVFLPGYRKDNTNLLNAFDYYILPSLWEGFSLSLLEAMAVKLPVIATDIKGNREIVTEGTGLLIPGKSVEAIEEAITKLLENPKQARILAEKGQEKYLREHTVDKMLFKTFSVYKKIWEAKEFGTFSYPTVNLVKEPNVV